MSTPQTQDAALDNQQLAELVARDIPAGAYVNLGIGQPTLVSDPTSRAAELYRDIARRAAALVSLLPKDYSSKLPGVQVVQPPSAPQS